MQKPNSNTENSEVALIGAGPVGSLLAVYLSRLGKKVRLYERRPDMRREVVSAGRSINLAISTRGIHALRELGLEEIAMAEAVPMRGRMIHSIQGELTFQRYGKDDSECIHSISRGGLNKVLMTAAEKAGVEIEFNQKLIDANLSQKSFRLEDEKSGTVRTLHADVIVGADGSASALRKAVLNQSGAVCSETALSYGYKELHIEPSSNGGFRMEKNALHIWPRGTYMLIALPNFDGSYTVTLFLPHEGPLSFASLKTPSDIDQFFREQFPDAHALMPDLKERFFSNPTGHMVTVKCSPWNLDNWGLLMGDAAHAIVPFFGQGMNCGFEDCTLLAEAIGKAKGPMGQIFESFWKNRKPDSDAIADLAVENFIEMRDKVGNRQFLLEKEVEKRLEKRFEGRYLSRYRLVTFHRVPYRLALKVGSLQNELLSELCREVQSADDVDYSKAEKLIETKLKGTLWT